MDALRQARALEQAGRWAEARDLLLRALDAAPEPAARAALLHRLGVVAAGLGRTGEAVTRYQASLDLRKDAETYLDFAALLGTVAHWDAAAACYAAALRLAPDSIDARYGLAVAHHQKGRAAEAEPHYRAVLAVRPDLGEVHNNLGVALQAMGRHGDAVPHHRAAVDRSPRDAPAWDNLGTALQRTGATAEAEAAHRRALALAAERTAAWNNLSCLHLAAGRPAAALHAAHRLAALAPNDPQALLAVGNAAHAAARWAGAVRANGAAVRLAPEDADARNNLANALAASGRGEAAVAELRRALEIRPGFTQAALNLAETLRGLQDDAGALAVLRGLLERDAANTAARRLAGLTHLAAHRPAEALHAFRIAVTLAPGDPVLWLELAAASSRTTDTAGLVLSVAAYRRVLRVEPEHAPAMAHLIQQQKHLCDWRDLDRLDARLIGHVRGGAGGVSPFCLLASGAGAADQRLAAGRWAAEKARGVPPALRPDAVVPAAPRDDRLRIGYLSADFREHAVAWLVAEVLELHDRRRVAVHAYSTGPDDGSAMRHRLMAAADRFVDLRDHSNAAAADRIAGDGVDILVDLTGYTALARTPILAARPAPVQVNWLGYPGTMGADFIDYILADPTVIPAGSEAECSEAVVRLPHSYQSNDRQRPIAARTPGRGDCGLPENGFVFCCFNSPYKLTPATFDQWARLLHAVPGSVLWLYAPRPPVMDNLRREAQARGVAADRLVFAAPRPLPEHLARHRLADLFLDTLPYNAHTTASDALWAGLPVLTRRGATFAGRVAASLLHAAGLPELVADSDDGYVATALELAGDPGRLGRLRRRLAEGLAQCPLFDTPGFTRHLEAAYRTMADIHRSGVAPRPFDVTAD